MFMGISILFKLSIALIHKKTHNRLQSANSMNHLLAKYSYYRILPQLSPKVKKTLRIENSLQNKKSREERGLNFSGNIFFSIYRKECGICTV